MRVIKSPFSDVSDEEFNDVVLPLWAENTIKQDATLDATADLIANEIVERVKVLERGADLLAEEIVERLAAHTTKETKTVL